MNRIEKQAFIDAAKEVETDKTDSGTWIKAMALAHGDEGVAKHEYIRLRAEELYGAETEASNFLGSYKNDKLRSIRGVVLAYVIWLGILYPPFIILLLQTRIQTTQEFYDSVGRMGTTSYTRTVAPEAKVAGWVLVLATSGISIWGAWTLVASSNSRSMKSAQRALWLSGPLAGACVAFIPSFFNLKYPMAEWHIGVPFAVASILSVSVKRSKNIRHADSRKIVGQSDSSLTDFAQIDESFNDALPAQLHSESEKIEGGAVTSEAKADFGEKHAPSVTYQLSDLIPKKTWWFYFLPFAVAVSIGLAARYEPSVMQRALIDICNGITLITAAVAFLCSIGRAIQALFKWSGTYAIAALIWAVIPLFHVGLTVFVMYRLGL
jgi:hypothetical protein